MQASGLPYLSSWQNFYIVVGSASATLTGLMFVVTTLIAGIETHDSGLVAGVDAFTTPTIVHFCAVLLTAVILSVPWQAFSAISLLLGLLGIAMVLYLVVVLRRMRRVPDYQTPTRDWVWYLSLPLIMYIVLTAAAIALPANPALVLYVIAAAMVAVLFLSLHNAWDLVTFLALQRSHPEDKGQG